MSTAGTSTGELERLVDLSVDLFRAAFEDAPIGMAVWSMERGKEFRPLEVNRAMCELLGRSAEELCDTPPREPIELR